MNEIKSEETIVEFIKEILEEDIENNEAYGLIVRWDKDKPYWNLFIVYDGKDGKRYCGGNCGLKATNMDDLIELFDLFARHNRKLIIDTKGYFCND